MPPNKGMIARSSPAGLAWFYSDGAWQLAPHLKLLSQRIVYAATHPGVKLLVTMPPRHGKSELISRFTPAWFLGNFPEKKVILAGYSDQFASTWGRASRDIIEEVGEKLFGVTVNQDAKGGQHWELNPPKNRRVLRPGVMTAAGVGGGITGKGADLLIIDDPVKTPQDAQSQAFRDNQWDWYVAAARTRLQPGASQIVVMTRWHEDDLGGRLLQNTKGWECISFPAICEVEGPDELDRVRGDALWPDMYPADQLLEVRAEMGSYWFGAMYQQHPSPAEGNLFKKKNFRSYSRDAASGVLTLHKDEEDEVFDPGYGSMFQTVDCAGSSKEESDFTVVSTWCVTPQHDLIWLDMEEVQFESLDIGGFVSRKFREFSPLLVGVERIGFGLTVIQELLRKGLPIMRLEPNLDKVARALPAVARTEEHRVFVPKDAAWRERAMSQLVSFPNSKNDDIVDTVSYAALMLPNVSPPGDSGRVQSNPGMTMLGDFLSRRL